MSLLGLRKSQPPSSQNLPPDGSMASPAFTFSTLPGELQLMIASYLPLSSRLALTLTCRRLYELLDHHLNIRVSKVFPALIQTPPPKLQSFEGPADYLPFAESLKELKRECQVFLSYVEKENGAGRVALEAKKGKKKNSAKVKVYCSHCDDYHLPWMFSESMLAAWRHVRKCKGAEGKMWICPHKAIEHQSVRDLTCIFRYSPGPLRHLILERQPIHHCNDCAHTVVVESRGVWITRPVLVVGDPADNQPRRRMATYAEVKAAMSIRDVRICPHVRMKDRLVYGAMVEGPRRHQFIEVGTTRYLWGKVEDKVLKARRLRMGIAEGFEKCRRDLPNGSTRFCSKCKTSWRMEMHGAKVIRLSVFRPFDYSHGVAHRTWYEHIAVPEEFSELEMEWRADATTYKWSPLTLLEDASG
ncbi:MAG: hypothetical protein Q9219_005503 [cf. Caloplaca sp. 3 TL-2023]